MMTAEEWNAMYPVGTKIAYYPARRPGVCMLTKTRSPAWGTGGGSVVVAIDGVPGVKDVANVFPLIAGRPVAPPILQRAEPQREPK